MNDVYKELIINLDKSIDLLKQDASMLHLGVPQLIDIYSEYCIACIRRARHIAIDALNAMANNGAQNINDINNMKRDIESAVASYMNQVNSIIQK